MMNNNLYWPEANLTGITIPINNLWPNTSKSSMMIVGDMSFFGGFMISIIMRTGIFFKFIKTIITKPFCSSNFIPTTIGTKPLFHKFSSCWHRIIFFISSFLTNLAKPFRVQRSFASSATEAFSHLSMLVSSYFLRSFSHVGNIPRYKIKSRRKYNGVNHQGFYFQCGEYDTLCGSKLGFRYHQLIGGLESQDFLNNPEYAGTPERAISRDSQLTLEAPRDYQGVSLN